MQVENHALTHRILFTNNKNVLKIPANRENSDATLFCYSSCVEKLSKAFPIFHEFIWKIDWDDTRGKERKMAFDSLFELHSVSFGYSPSPIFSCTTADVRKRNVFLLVEHTPMRQVGGWCIILLLRISSKHRFLYKIVLRLHFCWALDMHDLWGGRNPLV